MLPVQEERAAQERLLAGLRDGAAWAGTHIRTEHGDLIELVVLRVLDERRRGALALEELDPAIAAVTRNVLADCRPSFAAWPGERLEPLVALLVRQQAERFAQDATPHVALLSQLNTPTSVSADAVAADALAAKLLDTLERLPGSAGPIVALRLRGLSPALVAKTLGESIDQIRDDLGRIATRLAEVQTPTSRDAWRDLLGATTIAEHVTIAVRTEDEGPFRRARRLARATWARMAERSTGGLAPLAPGPLREPHVMASFAAGSLRGAERARAASHLTQCARCVEWVARLGDDLDAAEFAARVESRRRWTRLAAGAIVGQRLRLAESLAEAAHAADEPHGRLLGRLAEVGRAFEAEEAEHDTGVHDVSGVLPSPRGIPSDEEAPLAALEALAEDDPVRGFRAIDEAMAKHTVGDRLRLLAMASGPDLPGARRRAEAILASASPDPGLGDDARAVLALPPERALPREALIGRLRETLEDTVRFILRPS